MVQMRSPSAQEILSNFTRAFRAGVFVDITFSCNKQYPRVMCVCVGVCVCVSLSITYTLELILFVNATQYKLACAGPHEEALLLL